MAESSLLLKVVFTHRSKELSQNSKACSWMSRVSNATTLKMDFAVNWKGIIIAGGRNGEEECFVSGERDIFL